MAMYQIYSDGSCRDNRIGGGTGAYGFVVYKDNIKTHEYVETEIKTSNNRMEMKALISALEWCHSSCAANDAVIIYTDSNLVYRGINEWLDGWKRRGWKKADRTEVLNVDLWKRIDELVAAREVFIEKVPGHKDCERNNYIDRLVQNASAKARNNK